MRRRAEIGDRRCWHRMMIYILIKTVREKGIRRVIIIIPD